jgi:MoaA/NifB/PqqE/SkfB family radical SAM enzyme
MNTTKYAGRVLYAVGRLTPRSAWNLAHNTLEKLGQPVRPRSFPSTVDVVITKHCNLRCIFCKNYETEGSSNMTPELFNAIAACVLPAARRLNICSGGEPFLHPHLLGMLRTARRYRVYTWLLSNGMIYKEESMRAIVRERLVAEMGYSLDGMRPQTVAAIRRNANMEKVLHTIGRCIALKNVMGRTAPRITIRYTLMRSTIEELPEAIEYWGSRNHPIRLECNYLSLCNEIDRKESLFFHEELTNRVLADARQRSLRHPQLFLKLPPAIRRHLIAPVKNRACFAPWDFAWFDSDGRVFPCYPCMGAVAMGKIEPGSKPGDFKRLWHSKSYAQLRSTVNNDTVEKFFPYCSHCPVRLGVEAVDSHLGDQVLIEQVAADENERKKLVSSRSRG